MIEINLFVEDQGHQNFLGALTRRISKEYGIEVKSVWRNVRRGHGAVLKELKQFLRDLQRDRRHLPDLIVVATDGNCSPYSERLKELTNITDKIATNVVCAVPDPHVERWLLLDSAAFKIVFGRGCDAPDQKCEKNRYKKMLIDAIRSTGSTPSLGGIEFAEDIVDAMDLDRMIIADHSLGQLIVKLRDYFQTISARSE